MRVLIGDITGLKDVEAIVNAANGDGPMGRGVAGAIGKAGGPSFRNEVRRICEAARGIDAGEYYRSGAGELSNKGIRSVYHAVTMRHPGSPTSVAICEQAMRKTLEAAIKDGVKSIAFPGLGTGVGQLNKKLIAGMMASLAESYGDRIDITIIDLDKEFIDYVKGRVQSESEGS
jgi:O-acetyl-ADP-ribose deacetylase (regulator of RNase III)